MVKKIFLYGFLAFVGLIVLAAIFGDDEPTKVSGDKRTQTTAKQNDVSNKVFKVGDTVKSGDLEIKIVSAELRNPDQYINTKNGKVLKLEVSGKNNGSDSWYIDTSEFNLYSTDGDKYEMYFGTDGTPLGGEINAGKKIKGFLEYDVKQAGQFELVYKPSFLSDKEIKFHIAVK